MIFKANRQIFKRTQGNIGEKAPENIGFPNDGNVVENKTLADFYRHSYSASSTDGFALTDNGDGTVDIASGDVCLRSSDNGHAPIKAFHINTTAVVTLTNNSCNYIYADYNGGSPQLAVTVDLLSLDNRTRTPIYIIERNGTDLDWQDAGEIGVDFISQISRRFIGQDLGFAHILGTAITDKGTRKFGVDSGVFYLVSKRVPHDTFDTSVSDNFEMIYRNGAGGFTRTVGQTALPDTYDDGDGTPATIGIGKWGNFYVYLTLDNPSRLKVLMGRESYNSLAEAQVSGQPSDSMPFDLGGFSLGRFIGQIVVKQGVTPFADILSPFIEKLTSQSPTTHDLLSGVNQAGTGVTNGHISAVAQTIAGTKIFKDGLAVNAQTGTTYTLVLTDAGKMVTLSNASAITLTIPTNASVALPIGAIINFEQLGAGQVTFAGAGVTINSFDGNLKLAGQYAGAYLRKTATNTWTLIGNLTT